MDGGVCESARMFTREGERDSCKSTNAIYSCKQTERQTCRDKQTDNERQRDRIGQEDRQIKTSRPTAVSQTDIQTDRKRGKMT